MPTGIKPLQSIGEDVDVEGVDSGSLEQATRARLTRIHSFANKPAGAKSFKRLESITVRHDKAAYEKGRAAKDWVPEYKPESIISPDKTASVVADKFTRTSLAMITEEFPVFRKTKIVCTMGPSCWSEAGLAGLVDAGMGIARFNFSHGDHAAHQEVLDRLRKVLAEKGSFAATMLDTKGPEIRTAMLKDGKDIEIVAGQDVYVVAVGEEYTKWQGYKDPETGITKIGCSYGALCYSVKPGSHILCADGTLSLEVLEVLNGEVKCKAMNNKILGQRKNMNLPGVKVDLPVLTPNDINDVQNFCCKNKMDFIAASFVQTAADVRLIRKTLDDAGGQHVKIMCKIESMHGLINYDEILKETDGIMVARGDLAMEIPSEKVALAQKLMITKANIAGKFVFCATEMLASMADNPLPTRAEMTDVANAVFDGADGTMMSGETANGKFPDLACTTMASINENAELGIEHNVALRVVRYHNAGQEKVSPLEAMMSNVAKMALDFTEDADGNGVIEASETCFAVVITEDGTAANLISKYHPCCPVFVISATDYVLRQTNAHFAQMALPATIATGPDHAAYHVQAALAVLTHPLVADVVVPGQKIIVVTGIDVPSADKEAQIEAFTVVDRKHVDTDMVMRRAPSRAKLYRPPFNEAIYLTLAPISIGLDVIEKPVKNYRATNVFCTLGPKCWSEETLGALLDAGLDVARFNFSHGSHADHQTVLDRFRKVAAEKGAEMRKRLHLPCTPNWAVLLDTKGPEIRTAMLKDHQPIMLEADQEVIIYAAGAEYTTWEGYQTPEETKIGVSYAKLCTDVNPGQTILIADGTICIQVLEIMSDKELKGKVLNSNKLGERKNVNLPGVQVDIPVLTEKDIDDLQNFCCKNHMDFVAASFVQTAADVRFIRKVLDEAGGHDVKIISKIENAAGLENYGDILKETDGIMVARGDLGMEIPSEKVALAQKMMISRARIAGKFVVTATQMLASMEFQPLPTRAEMTDVANAVFDGTDSVMLSGETANGAFPAKTVTTMAAIVQNAEVGINRRVYFNYVSRFTPKPMPTLEAVCRGAAQATMDMGATIILVITSSLEPVTLVAKYRPLTPIIVATNCESVAAQARAVSQAYGMLLDQPIASRSEVLAAAIKFARGMGFGSFSNDGKSEVIMVCGKNPVVLGDGKNMGDARIRMYRMGNDAKYLIKPTFYGGEKTIAYRSEEVSLDLLTNHVTRPRKTKIVCTLGPKCWSEENLDKLLDAGMNVARFNFSHGDHAAHQEVLDRLRKVAAKKGSPVGYLLDTKGPEIRTAMLRDHKAIQLEKGQSIIIEAVGADYTTFEGYKTETETRIGLSYAKLCETLVPGNTILIADGTISIQVEEVLNLRELRGTVLNSKSLGERKNCNLPGVQVDIPVLTSKDIDDLQNFAAKNDMDYVAASFVQTADDVRFIRWTLDEAGGQHVKIFCKIENEAGLRNYDEILQVTDGIMVARGDLGMEIPSEKVAIAQKLMITKANIASKKVIVATQMLASMEDNPLPTRAEMTDVANAVFDGSDAVMLSGETANGTFPDKACATMASIVQNAEQGLNAVQNFNFIRNFTPKPLGELQAVMAAAAKLALDIDAGLIIALSKNGIIARMVAKYRPRVPILLVTDSEQAVRHTNLTYAVFPYKKATFPRSSTEELARLVDDCMTYAVGQGLCPPGKEVVVISGVTIMSVAMSPSVAVRVAPGLLSPYVPRLDTSSCHVRTATLICLDDVVSSKAPPRKVKMICTLGPCCWSEEGLGALIDAGMGIARFNFSHGDHAAHQAVFDRLKGVAAAKDSFVAFMLDTKGPEVRTAMLRDGKDIELVAGQEVTLVACGEDYVTWEGFKDEATGETKIGCSYAKLCTSVEKDSVILVSDGTLSIQVKEILSDKELVGICLNNKKLGQRKNMNLPGVKVDLPVLTEKDIQDVQEFACKNKMDFIAVSFVQTADDVRLVRDVLDSAGGEDIQIIAKIESTHGLINYDAILQEVDGIMVARGDLAMEIPPEKVSLAQKMLITKANIAGKFVFCATEMLASMADNPLPTRAEMTDVANAVFDGVDGTMLSGESANGKFPIEAVSTMARIVRNADMTTSTYIQASFLRDHTPKPFSPLESIGSVVCTVSLDTGAGLIVTLSQTGKAAGYVSKYRAPVPQMVVSTQLQTLRHTNGYFGQIPVFVPEFTNVPDLVKHACKVAKDQGYWSGEGTVVVVHGRECPDADRTPALRAIEVSI